MTKQALRRQQRVHAILESAVAAFRRHGYHGTSMEQIADQLLMTKGSLYYYFKDKEEILFAVHDQALDRILDELARIRKSRKAGKAAACPCEQVEEILSAHIRIMVEGFHGTALALEFAALSPRRLASIVAKRDRYERGLRELVERGGRDGCFRPVDPKMTVLALLGAVNWIARWHRSDGPSGYTEVARTFLDLFMGGLLPRGRERASARTEPSGGALTRAAAPGSPPTRPASPRRKA